MNNNNTNIDHVESTQLFGNFNNDLKTNKDNINPTNDYFMPLSDSVLTDAAVSWEKLYKNSNMSDFKAKKGFESLKSEDKKNLIAFIDTLAEAFLRDGLNIKTGERLEMTDWFRELENLNQHMMRDYGTGASSIVTRQVVTRMIEKLEVEDTVYQIFTKKMTVRTNEEIILPVTTSVAQASLDMGPSTEPHILSVSNDATMIAKCGRSGIAVELQHEAIRLSKFNLMNLYLTEAKNSLRRWKDIKAIRTAFNAATVVYDNLEPEKSILGKTSGMSFKTGKYNGTLTLRDFYRMYLLGVQNGTVCETVLLSTIGWLIFISDPIMQRFAEKNGGVIFRGPSGKIGQDLDPYRAMISGTRPEKNRINTSIPDGLMNVAFRFIVTPFVPFYTEGQVIYKNASLGDIQRTPYLDSDGQPVKCGKDPMTNLIMLDSSKGMLYLEEEGVKSAEEKDFLREKTRIHLTERYTFNEMYRGEGILVAKNISVSDDNLDVRTYYSVSLTEAKNAIADAEKKAE